MSLVVYNTETQQKEKFQPLTPGEVKMYCCGPTVYGLLHVGNFRGAIFYNLVRNWLEASAYKVNFVYNFTDVDDKIINRANDEGKKPEEISEFYIAEFLKDYRSLGLRQHSHNPRVTEYMPQIIQMVQDLIAKGKAYVVNGEVLYSIKEFAEYGKLSHRNPDELLAGARVEVDDKKQSPMDFALWKPAKPGEPSWDSPWGPGRPGWHIECSVMSKEILGEQIDIHGGGSDLVFPHHENEIAQSEGCSGKQFVRYWLHNNMITMGAQKMSKSLGNIQTARDFIEANGAEIFKYLILSVHYRSLSSLSEEAIERATSGLARIYSAMAVAESFSNPGSSQEDPGFNKKLDEGWQEITRALNDDFNTPEAFAAVFEGVRQFNGLVKRGVKVTPIVYGRAQAFLKWVRKFGELNSLFQLPAQEFLTSLDNRLLEKKNIKREAVDKLVQERLDVRKNKDYKKSDEIRDQLLQMGIQLSDTAEGTFWEVQK